MYIRSFYISMSLLSVSNGAVAVRDVREGPRVHQRGRALQRLHRVRRQRVHHEHRQGT